MKLKPRLITISSQNKPYLQTIFSLISYCPSLSLSLSLSLGQRSLIYEKCKNLPLYNMHVYGTIFCYEWGALKKSLCSTFLFPLRSDYEKNTITVSKPYFLYSLFFSHTVFFCICIYLCNFLL